MLEDLPGFLSTERPIPSLDIRDCARIRTLPVEGVQAIHRSSRLVLSGLESLEDFTFLTTLSDVGIGGSKIAAEIASVVGDPT